MLAVKISRGSGQPFLDRRLENELEKINVKNDKKIFMNTFCSFYDVFFFLYVGSYRIANFTLFVSHISWSSVTIARDHQ